MAILQLEEFQSGSGKYHVQINDLVGTGVNWIAPARILGMDVAKFVLMLKNEYGAEITIYRKEDNSIKFIGYQWTSLELARKFKNRVNMVAREKKITRRVVLNG